MGYGSPPTRLAVKSAAVAMPEGLVEAVVFALWLSANVPLGPLLGAWNVTVMPMSGWPEEFRTCTASGGCRTWLMNTRLGFPTQLIESARAGFSEFLTAMLTVVAPAVATEMA